jgi:hypothetical protein
MPGSEAREAVDGGNPVDNPHRIERKGNDMIDAISNFLQPSVRFFKLLHDDPFRVYVTAALLVGPVQWSVKKGIGMLVSTSKNCEKRS